MFSIFFVSSIIFSNYITSGISIDYERDVTNFTCNIVRDEIQSKSGIKSVAILKTNFHLMDKNQYSLLNCLMSLPLSIYQIDFAKKLFYKIKPKIPKSAMIISFGDIENEVMKLIVIIILIYNLYFSNKLSY